VVVVDWSLVSIPVSIVVCTAAVAAAVILPSRTALARAPLWGRLAVITGCGIVAAATTAVVTADVGGAVREFVTGVSLTHGWFLVSAQAIAAVTVVCGIGWRTRRWRPWRLPVALGVGLILAAGAYCYVVSAGLAGEPAPWLLWTWVGLTGLAAGVLVLGWREARWWRRTASVVAVPMSVLSCALVLNAWVGYFPTVSSAWSALTSRALADQTDRATVVAMQESGAMPARGVVVSVTTSARASGFHHRDELVYLPPAWFASNRPPPLPVVMMIGAEFNTPTDWLRAGNAASTADDFAAAHGGNAPVLVFVDAGGAFDIDTECVNGTRGNAADHLTKDIVPFMVSNFGVSADPARWGVAGFSAGGTCAVDLTVRHPELFSAFVDIAGDLSPNTGTKDQTIARLFGGNVDAWAAFDPTTVITRHGIYHGISGWFAVADAPAGSDAADTLCGVGRLNGIDCAVVGQPGNHDWSFGARAFTAAMPWLAGRLGTPAAPAPALPPHPPPTVSSAPRLSLQAVGPRPAVPEPPPADQMPGIPTPG
jgi:S-formylglutathione hydrolase FrmB